METIESLIAQNRNFHETYTVLQKDVDLCNHVIKVIENTRNTDKPTEGDIIQCYGPNAEYLFGHLERGITDDYASICTKPSTPFVTLNDYFPIFNCDGENEVPRFSTSGGYWLGCNDINMYEYKGKSKKVFQVWGNCGACAGGTVKFEAEVNVWKLFMEDIY